MKSPLIGHKTKPAEGTGLTVFLFEDITPCGVWICGSAPATREIELLRPEFTVCGVNAILFSGGSAFGLDAANGVMSWLQEKNQGIPTKLAKIPIVPTACIYDLHTVISSFPTAEDAYQACANAEADNSRIGKIGVGTGASVGKIVKNAKAMPGGFGISEISNKSGLTVKAYVAVNAAGDIIDEKGCIVAGARYSNGSFANTMKCIQAGKTILPPFLEQSLNTTLALIVTNAGLDKAQLTRIAKTASAGIAKSVSPAFTAIDGDIAFCASLGKEKFDEISVAALSIMAIEKAIINAVQ
jgi:L-aminopeptidase/D-esterase-like protein